MSLLSLAHLLLDRPMQKRFASVPLFQATMLLLQERIPKAPPSMRKPPRSPTSEHLLSAGRRPVRVFSTAPTRRAPRCSLLSNGATT
jgi:cyclic beta-1,2-glucan synthetase